MASGSFAGYVDTNFANAANWYPAGPPQAGDVGSISMARAAATGILPDNVTLVVTTRAFAGRSGSLLLQNGTIPLGTWISSYTFFDTFDGSLPASLSIAGTFDNKGTLVFSGGTQTITLPSGTTVLNEGTLAVDSAASTFSGGSSFTNNGLVRVVNPENQAGQIARFDLALGGTGTIGVSANATVELGASVGSGQSVVFTGGTAAGATIDINTSSLFAGTIGGFVSGDNVLLNNTSGSAAVYVPNGPASGTLQISNAGTVVASLALSGVYATGDFTLTQTGSSLGIATLVTDSATGSIAAPTATGLFRFFDKVDGSHFFTASVAERDAVAVRRPDLVQETNGFGAATPASGGTEAVFRFFDTVHGTHFFTASTFERDQVIASRPDLTYEPSATFLEHTGAQTGDVAVYRLFSTIDGTHLYTASATELNGLTTPGGTSYRADLVSEGVSFYAPSGTYT